MSPRVSSLENPQILTSIRSDGLFLYCESDATISGDERTHSQFYMLSHHRDRMLAATKEFGWKIAAVELDGLEGLSRFQHRLQSHLREKYNESTYPNPLRMRITLSPTGTFAITSSPVPAVSKDCLYPSQLSLDIPEGTAQWTIQLSTVPVPCTLYTKHKTTLRAPYDSARAHLATTDITTEILVQNQEGEIMEGTLTTPYFFRCGSWVTPKATSGGNIGTTRRWALENGLCVEAIVKAEDLIDGELVWLSNGVRGFGLGPLDLGLNQTATLEKD